VSTAERRPPIDLDATPTAEPDLIRRERELLREVARLVAERAEAEEEVVAVGGAVVEQGLAETLGLQVGDTISVGGHTFHVVGIAVTTARPFYPARDPGLIWLTRADAEGLATAGEANAGFLHWLHPLRRSGPKGSGQFERISWEAALDEIHRRVGEVVDRWGPQAVTPLNYAGPPGFLAYDSLSLRFFHQLGRTQRRQPFGAHQLLGFAPGRKRCENGARTRGQDIEHGVVPRLADRHAAASQQPNEIITKSFDHNPGGNIHLERRKISRGQVGAGDQPPRQVRQASGPTCRECRLEQSASGRPAAAGSESRGLWLASSPRPPCS